MNIFKKSMIRASWVTALGISTAAAQDPDPGGAVEGSRVGDSSADKAQAAEEVASDELAKEPENPLDRCVASHEAAQLSKLSGGLIQSQKHLLECSRSVCPEALRDDCFEWRQELEQLIPTVIVVAEGDEGDIHKAVVVVDGEVVRESLDGRVIQLDPGAHEITLRLEDGSEKSQKLVLSEGERARRVYFNFITEKPPAQPVVAPVPQPTLKTERPVPAMTYVLGGVSVVAATVGVVSGVRALSMQREAEDVCAPLCSADVSRAVRERAAIADVGIAVSLGAALGSALVYLYRPERVVEVEPGLAWGLSVGPRSGTVSLGGQF